MQAVGEKASVLARPGAEEVDAFECDASVAVWSDFQRLGSPGTEANLRSAAEIVARYTVPGG